MTSISTFRGASGEVVKGFLSPATLFTTIPVLFATLLLGALGGLVVKGLGLPMPASVPMIVVFLSPPTGLFAVAARAGHLDAGFMDALSRCGGLLPNWVLRHGVLSVAWGIPAGLAITRAGAAVMHEMAVMQMTSQHAQVSALAASMVVVALGLLLLLVMPTLALLVATRADTVGECFSQATWRWLLIERGWDLPVMMASMIGAATIFTLATLPVGALFAIMVARSSAGAGAAIGVAVYLVPALSTAILCGRMAGAFAAADHMDLAAAAPEASPSGASVVVATRPSRRVVAPVLGPSLMGPLTATPPGAAAATAGLALARLKERAEADPAGALPELRALQLQAPRNAAISAEIAACLLRAGQEDEACAAASEAVKLALATGGGPVAREVFETFRERADRLSLDPSSFEQLARVLLTGGDWTASAWCHRAAASLGGDPVAAQKGLLAAADRASKAGDGGSATALYQALVTDFPGTPAAEVAQRALARRRT